MYIDLTHTVSHGTPAFPGDPETSLTKLRSAEADGYNLSVLSACLHTGTHIDLPLHWAYGGKTAADYPVGRFMGNGVLLDVRNENPIRMKPEYLNAAAENDIVLLYTGFGEYFRDGRYFTDYPAVDGCLADFFISKRIGMLGMDTPSPDRPPFTQHRKLLSGGILILENLTNLQSLIGAERFEVIALPLKVRAEAGPARVVCKV